MLNPGCNDESDGVFTIKKPLEGSPICATAPPSVEAGSEFWVEITVDSEAKPVTDLFSVAFELFYTNTNICDYLTYETGLFMSGSNVTVQQDDPNGKISVSVSRADSGGISGNFTVLRLKFKVSAAANNGEKVCFNLDNVDAQNKFGAQISLGSCDNSCVEVGGCFVWPGDADKNGACNIFDIMPIVNINNWDKTGPARPGATTDWKAQPGSYWTPESATYCDCNGNGKVDIFDILVVVGPNFGKTHTLLFGSAYADASATPLSKNSVSDPPIFIEAREYDEINKEFWIDVIVGSSSQPVTDLKSIAFELTYANTLNINYDCYQMGAFLSGATATVMPEPANGKVSAAVYKLSGQGQSGAGIILSIKFKTCKGNSIDFNFPGVQAEASDGSKISLAPQTNTLVTNVAGINQQVTKDFALIQNYPNPFNHETIIKYTLPKVSDVRLMVYDNNGREIRKLVNEQKDAGFYSATWNGRDNKGKVVCSGLYFYKIEIQSRDAESQSFFDVKKMILMK